MKLKFFLEEEEHKGILLILSFILGIIIYFSLPFEPGFFKVLGLFILSFLLIFFCFYKRCFKFASMALFFLIFGVFISKAHTQAVETKFLPEEIEHASVTGIVSHVEEKTNSFRLTLENVFVESIDKTFDLKKARFWVSKKSISKQNFVEQDLVCQNEYFFDEISDKRGIEKESKKISTDTCVFKKPAPNRVGKGDLVTGKIFSLRAPSMPSQSGGYFEARSLFFEGIEAVGSFSNVLILKENLKESSGFDTFRNLIKEKISFLNPETKGVIQALILGDADLITTPIDYLYRSLGLTHILSVSGFHVGLVAFLIYYFVRFLLTLITLKYNASAFVIRGISALCALLFSFYYVCLTGAEPPAVRAFIMTGFVFLCFFFNRNVLSLRTIFIAAFLLLCYKPVLILNVGFQLSFMAVLTLCVLVKHIHEKMKQMFYNQRFLLFIVGLIVLNLLVTLISIPFIGYHFHKIPIYGIVGNLLLSFMFSLFIMPLLLLGVIFVPLNGEKIFFELAEKVLSFVHLIGAEIASLPYSMVPIESFSVWGLILFAFGFIIFSCMSGKIKYIGSFMMIISLFSFLTYPKSDIRLARQGRLIAVRMDDGNWRLNESYIHRFVSDNWLLSNSQLPEFYSDTKVFRPNILFIKGAKIAFDPDFCSNADLTFELRKKDYSHCPNLFSKEQLKETDGIDIFIRQGKILLTDFSKTDENRPWNQKKKH